MRLFIGIKTGCEDYLKALQDELKACGRGNFTHAENLHLTLKFLGEVPPLRIQDISEAMTQAAGEPFPLEVRGAKAFNRSIVAAELGGNLVPLTSLAARLDNELEKIGFDKEARPFRAHITLAREFKANPGCDISAIPHNTCRFSVDEMILFESTRENGRLVYKPLFKQELK